ncbi:MAG TPA: hypothetical protein VG676_13565 [Chitinophagaceae bacterium]|jgi:hypothetical protein|nr:hypothetical protein [Chitinophagaceae bacterium]
MKIIFLIAILFFNQFMIHAQDSWTIKWNKKTVLVTNKEDEVANSRKIKPSAWKKNGNLEIIYKEAEPDTVLWHSFLLFDEADHQLLSKEKTLYAKISISLLRKLFAGKKQIKIYTIVSPRNPKFAVRMRRVHLCTLQITQ